MKRDILGHDLRYHAKRFNGTRYRLARQDGAVSGCNDLVHWPALILFRPRYIEIVNKRAE